MRRMSLDNMFNSRLLVRVKALLIGITQTERKLVTKK